MTAYPQTGTPSTRLFNDFHPPRTARNPLALARGDHLRRDSCCSASYATGRGSNPLLIGIGIALAALFAVQLVTATLRIKLQKPVKATGVVEVKEREVGYLAPDGGAFVSLDDLTKLEIVTTDKGRCRMMCSGCSPTSPATHC